jgi:hypothetical protein
MSMGWISTSKFAQEFSFAGVLDVNLIEYAVWEVGGKY